MDDRGGMDMENEIPLSGEMEEETRRMLREKLEKEHSDEKQQELNRKARQEARALQRQQDMIKAEIERVEAEKRMIDAEEAFAHN